MPTTAPLVTCIIIFLNGEPFLDEAIASIMAQSYPHWELLLVDDGSTDGSTARARSYAAHYPDKVRYLEHEGHRNCGMSATRNLGISHARGQYIAFLDADDIWLPHKLEQQVAIMQAHPAAGMVYGRTTIWQSWRNSEATQPDYVYELGVAPDTLVQPPTLAIQLLRNTYQTPTTCNALLRREVVAAVGGFEPQFRSMYEDQVFFFKVELATAVFVAGTHWANYRQHEQSASAQAEQMASYYAARLPFLSWCEHYLKTQGVTDPGVWRALRSELWPCRHPKLSRLLHRSRAIAKRTRRATIGALKMVRSLL